MKKLFFSCSVIGMTFLFSSCATIFTKGKQEITFVGEKGVTIYDKNAVIAKIGEGGTATARVKKRLSNKTLIAKKDGYKNVPLTLDAQFNPISILNLLSPISWAIDLGTGKCCKWENEVIEFEMNEKK